MQRYRVNYPLLAGLVIGFVLLAAGSFFLRRFQIDRNASRLLAKADAAEASGNLEEAFGSLLQYIQFRPREFDSKIRLGEVGVKLTEQEDLEPKLRGEGFKAVVDVVRDTGNIDETDPEETKRRREANAKLRRKLVDLQTMFGAPDLALANIN
jgi:hypothetical protein